MKALIICCTALLFSAQAYSDDHKALSNATVDSPNIGKGRLLASNCFQCHNTQGFGGFERLTGVTQISTFAEMMEQRFKFKNKEMVVHAKGYTKEQLWDLAGYLASIQVTPQR